MLAVESTRTLTEAVEALAITDVDALGDAELHDELVGLLRLSHRLDAAISARAARWDSRGLWAYDGSKSAPARLARETGTARASAQRVLRRGRALAEMPVAAEALAAGEISPDHVDLLASANARQRVALFTRDEKLLVDDAKTLRYDQLVKVVAYWVHHADSALGDDGDPPPDDDRQARIGPGVNGDVVFDAVLDPIGGAEVTEALRRIADQLAGEDRHHGRVTRSKKQLQADALVEMARRATAMPAGANKPRPLVTIVCGHQAFAELCELANGAVITPGQLVPHLGRIDIETIIFDTAFHAVAASNQRSFTGALRRAIEVRDRHCQHPSGCDEPINRCDVDHIVARCRGGLTDQANGRLLCVYHNRIEPQLTRPPAAPSDPHDRSGVGHDTADPTTRQRPPPPLS